MAEEHPHTQNTYCCSEKLHIVVLHSSGRNQSLLLSLSCERTNKLHQGGPISEPKIGLQHQHIVSYILNVMGWSQCNNIPTRGMGCGRIFLPISFCEFATYKFIKGTRVHPPAASNELKIEVVSALKLYSDFKFPVKLNIKGS